MNCVKCGREIPEDQVFCEICLTEMENYPVKPGTAVHIPARTPEEEQTKKTAKRKRILTTEEQLLRTRKKLQRTRKFLVLLLLLCGALSFLMAQAVLELDFQRLMGRNYRTEEGSGATKPATEWTQLTTEPTKPEAPAPAAKTQPEETRPETTPEATPAPAPAPQPEPTPTEAPTAPPTEAPTDAPTEAPADSATEPPAEPTEPAPPVTEAPVEPTVAVEPTDATTT